MAQLGRETTELLHSLPLYSVSILACFRVADLVPSFLFFIFIVEKKYGRRSVFFAFPIPISKMGVHSNLNKIGMKNPKTPNLNTTGPSRWAARAGKSTLTEQLLLARRLDASEFCTELHYTLH